MERFLFSVISFAISFVLMPLIIKFCNKKKLYDYADERKIHSGNISRLGGVGIFFSFFIVACIFILNIEGTFAIRSFAIIISAFIIFTFAIIDDILNMRAIIKLIVQLVAVSIVTFNGYRFKQIFAWQLPTWFSYGLTFFWILGVINAYNLIDGLDGLCGMLSITTIITLGVLYFIAGNYEAFLCFILAGSILGFLCWNYPPAKLFMGDNGSQFIGFMVATIPLYTSNDIFEYNKFLIMVSLTTFPCFDTIATIWRRIRDKKPIMSPDKSHLHHKLLRIGYSQKHTLLLITFLQLLMCTSVVISFFLGKLNGMMILFFALFYMILFFSVIHFENSKALKKQKLSNSKNEQ